jgi:hypothetical protein
MWLKRFNASGLVGLEDHTRVRHPARDTTKEVVEVIATALTAPQQLGLPFGTWSWIDELLNAEGLRWCTQETWFCKGVDLDFAKKRGISKPST